MTTTTNCLFWGALGPHHLAHPDCDVVYDGTDPGSILTSGGKPIYVVEGPFPRVCPCECLACKRAWFANGQPIVRDGKIVRRTGP